MTVETKKKIIQLVCGLAVIALLIGAFLICEKLFSPDEVSGSKTITVVIKYTDADGEHSKTRTVTTEASTLGKALEGTVISGDEGAYGLFVTTVDGITADASKEQWWKLTKNGVFLNTGVSDTVINDGDTYEITLVEGYSFYEG